MKFQDVKNFIDNNSEFKSRADQYRAMSLYFGVEDETIKEMMSFNRYLRDIWPIDSVGIAKEAEHHKSPVLWGMENQSKKLMDDLLKYS